MRSREHDLAYQTESDPFLMVVGQEATQVIGELTLLNVPK